MVTPEFVVRIRVRPALLSLIGLTAINFFRVCTLRDYLLEHLCKTIDQSFCHYAFQSLANLNSSIPCPAMKLVT